MAMVNGKARAVSALVKLRFPQGLKISLAQQMIEAWT